MKITRTMWDMPVSVCIADPGADPNDVECVYRYFTHVDRVFSTFLPDSEVSRINRGEIPEDRWSSEFAEVIRLSEETTKETLGYFDCRRNGRLYPLGLVKGWALRNAEILLKDKGYRNFYVEAGGDMALAGRNGEGNPWRIGIRNPFDRDTIVRVLRLTDCGVATSGTYMRGDHIYNPVSPWKKNDTVSVTVIAANVYDADRFATAAFAMGEEGMGFIARTPDLQGYMINARGIATYTAGFPADGEPYDRHRPGRFVA